MAQQHNLIPFHKHKHMVIDDNHHLITYFSPKDTSFAEPTQVPDYVQQVDKLGQNKHDHDLCLGDALHGHPDHHWGLDQLVGQGSEVSDGPPI